MTGRPRRALLLLGGGARAAYQVGVLDGIRQVLAEAGWPADRNPFGVICGTSAGAINAVALASGADHFSLALRRLHRIWAGLSAERIYRNDAITALLQASRSVGSMAFGWSRRSSPRSLFDIEPLRELLEREIDLGALHRLVNDGTVSALAITATSYTSGHHVTFFESARTIDPWYRSQRLAAPALLDVRHLLASSAIPFLFPAVALPIGGQQQFFGDGSMRQTAPLAPAVHLGADQILVIGAGQLETSHSEAAGGSQFHYPSLAQIAGQALSGIFLDALGTDLERAERVNRTLASLSAEARRRNGLKPLRILTILPSEPLDTLATPHLRELSRPVRALLRLVGGADQRGAHLMSYLLFEPGYIAPLLALGRHDALAQRQAIRAFFESGDAAVSAAQT